MQFDEARERALIRRLVWRTMPLLTLCYMAAVIDRSNVGFAKLQMVRDLHMSEIAYGLGASLYFWGYLLFEIPSILMMLRFGTRLWLARIMLTWGCATLLLGFTISGTMFYCVRFLLGVAEAGLHPGAVYFLMQWFPPQARAQVIGLLQMGGALGNIFAALMGGPLLDLDGALGLAGWQWVFIVTGLPPLALAAIVLRYLSSTPREAPFLSGAEKDFIEAAASRFPPERPSNPFAVLWQPRIVFFGFIETLVLTSLYGIIYWFPTVIKGFGVTGTEIGLLTAIPWIVSAVSLVFLPPLMRRDKVVLAAFTAISLVGLAAFLVSALVTSNSLRFAGLVVGTPCVQLLIPCTWAAIARYMTGPRAAPSIAAVSTISTLGGFFAQNLMPWVARLAGSPVAALFVPAACLAILALMPLLLRQLNSSAGPAPGPLPIET